MKISCRTPDSIVNMLPVHRRPNTDFFAYSIFDLLLGNGWRVFAETFPMFHTIGAAPYHLAGRPTMQPMQRWLESRSLITACVH